MIFLNNKRSFLDGSALVTALLLLCTLSPLTPWYVAAFGSFCAILFGKIVWGGLGKNRLNPALVGREFMSVFFAAVMTSPNLWKSQHLVHISSSDLFSTARLDFLLDYLSLLVFKTSGAMGEYSILAIILGGLYLLIRKRISWHIPLTLLATWCICTWLNGTDPLSYSIAGTLLGTIFMATDMPSSPTTEFGKIYYGTLIGICAFIFVKAGIRFEYMSFSILLMNGFSERISQVFKPIIWGARTNYHQKLEAVILLTIHIAIVAAAIIALYYYHLLHYAVYLYLAFIIYKFNYSFSKKIHNYV